MLKTYQLDSYRQRTNLASDETFCRLGVETQNVWTRAQLMMMLLVRTVNFEAAFLSFLRTEPAAIGARSAVRETTRHEEEVSLRDTGEAQRNSVLCMPHGGLSVPQNRKERGKERGKKHGTKIYPSPNFQQLAQWSSRMIPALG